MVKIDALHIGLVYKYVPDDAKGFVPHWYYYHLNTTTNSWELLQLPTDSVIHSTNDDSELKAAARKTLAFVWDIVQDLISATVILHRTTCGAAYRLRLRGWWEDHTQGRIVVLPQETRTPETFGVVSEWST